jgi:hypothetical protein
MIIIGTNLCIIRIVCEEQFLDIILKDIRSRSRVKF